MLLFTSNCALLKCRLFAPMSNVLFSFLIAVICCWYGPNKNMPWPPYSSADSKKAVDGCRLNGFLMFPLIGPFIRFQIAAR